MSTDHVDRIYNQTVNNVDDLLNLLSISYDHFSDTNIHNYINLLWIATNEIWEEQNLKDYTIHDIKHHSVNIIKFFMNQYPIYGWSDYEKIVFTSAALIHDLGMQYEYWAPRIDNEKERFKNSFTATKIREKHAGLAYELIDFFLTSQGKWDKLAPFCDLSKSYAKIILRESSIIAAAHSGSLSKNIYLQKLVNESHWKESSVLGNNIHYRPRLLAGTLILCDELDGDFERVKEPIRLHSWNLDEESIKYWLGCLFIRKVILIPEGDSFRIKIRWQVPDGSNLSDREIIRQYIDIRRRSKIQKEIDRIHKFYETCEETNHIVIFTVDDFESEPCYDFSFSIDQRDLIIVKKEVIKYLESNKVKNKSLFFNISERPKQRDEIHRLLPKNKVLKEEYDKLVPTLNSWYEDNKKHGHFELIGGDHTDVFINCRTLSINPIIIRNISEFVFSLMVTEGLEINRVMSVGTSAIVLSNQIAQMLKCGSTFTIKKRKGKTEESSYTPFEITPYCLNNENILIIDDLISGGRDAIEAVNSLDSIGVNYKNVYHLSIFRLGNRKIEKDKKRRIEKYYWLIHNPNILYFEKGKCKLCDSHWRPTKEIQMF